MSTGGPEETNQKFISNCLRNEIKSKRAEFKTSTVINIIMNIIYWPKQELVCKKRQTTNELLADNEIMRKRLGIMFHFKKLKNR